LNTKKEEKTLKINLFILTNIIFLILIDHKKKKKEERKKKNFSFSAFSR
jgi:hypothetical protein